MDISDVRFSLSTVCTPQGEPQTEEERSSLAVHPRAWWLAGTSIPRVVHGPVTAEDSAFAERAIAHVAFQIADAGDRIVAATGAAGAYPVTDIAVLLRAAPANTPGRGIVERRVREVLETFDPLLAPYHGAQQRPYGPLNAGR